MAYSSNNWMEYPSLVAMTEMESQEVFDTVARHLQIQANPAYVGDAACPSDVQCKYRSESGLKCAAGCLISDEDYDPQMEGRSVGSLFGYTEVGNYKLLSRLQGAHDSWAQTIHRLGLLGNVATFKQSKQIIADNLERTAKESGLEFDREAFELEFGTLVG